MDPRKALQAFCDASAALFGNAEVFLVCLEMIESVSQ
jgi:hypothetical protein